MNSVKGSFGLWLLLCVTGLHAGGALLDALSAIGYPYEIAFGEGGVWQLTKLIFERRTYDMSAGLPFTVFHYPPVYFILVRAIGIWTPDLLMAGRIVSTLATGIFAFTAGGIVFAATLNRISSKLRLETALLTALLILSMPNIRAIGFLMRVDMVANALSLLALLVAFYDYPGLIRTFTALILAMLAVFTKQTEFSAGVSIFAVLVRVQPRQTFLAALIAAVLGLSVVAYLQWETQGGFLRHLIVYNLNRFEWAGWLQRIAGERDNLPLIGAVCGILAVGLWRSGGGWGRIAAD